VGYIRSACSVRLYGSVVGETAPRRCRPARSRSGRHRRAPRASPSTCNGGLDTKNPRVSDLGVRMERVTRVCSLPTLPARHCQRPVAASGGRVPPVPAACPWRFRSPGGSLRGSPAFVVDLSPSTRSRSARSARRWKSRSRPPALGRIRVRLAPHPGAAVRSLPPGCHFRNTPQADIPAVEPRHQRGRRASISAPTEVRTRASTSAGGAVGNFPSR
jgi:hypothetical protein